MRAIILPKPGEVELTEREIPRLQEGESLIKVKRVGICGTDLHLLQGQHASATYPLVPGHEFVGELVESKGEGGERFSPGDIVVAQEVLSCGSCEACAKGEDNVCTSLKIIGVHADGGFADYVKVKTHKAYKMPKDIDLDLAALTEPLAVAVHDVRRSGLQAGETALIVGGGPIGLLIAMVAKQTGARKVVISEVSAFRRQFAEDLGFDTIDPDEAGFAEKIAELHEGRLFDVSFECAGATGVLNTCIELTKCTGTVVLIAISSEPVSINTFPIFAKGLRIQGVRIHSLYNFMGAVDLIQSGQLNKQLKKLISRVYPLEQTADAFEYAQNGKDAFKVLVKVND